MATARPPIQFIESLRSRFALATKFERARMVATAIYVFLLLLSLAWGLSPLLSLGNQLGAEIRVGRTSDGSTFVTVSNRSDQDWRDVKIVADEDYFVRAEIVSQGTQFDSALRDFQSQRQLPRPVGMFFWDNVGTAPPEQRAPADLVPKRISVSANGQTYVEEVQL